MLKEVGIEYSLTALHLTACLQLLRKGKTRESIGGKENATLIHASMKARHNITYLFKINAVLEVEEKEYSSVDVDVIKYCLVKNT